MKGIEATLRVLAYCEGIDRAMLYAAAIGGIKINDGLVSVSDLSKHYDAIKKICSKKGYLQTRYMDDAYVFTWGRGRSGKLKEAYEYDESYRQWNKMPMPFLRKKYEIVLHGKIDQRQWGIVNKLFNSDKIDVIYSVCDYEREGELTFSYVLELSGTAKINYCRIKISETAQESIRKAFADPIPQSRNLAREFAARERAIADFLVGANMTAYTTLKLNSGKPKEDRVKAAYIGRVKTPALYMVYIRDKAIKEFEPSEKYGAKGVFVTESGVVYEGFPLSGKRFDTEEDAAEYIADNYTEGTGEICGGGCESREEYAPHPYDTNTLCIEANKLLGIPLNTILRKHLQSLYMPKGGKEGYITFPRTESKHFSEDKKGGDIIKRLSGLYEISSFGPLIRGTDAHPMYFRNEAVRGHDAITIMPNPIDTATDNNALMIYIMIAKRTLALTYPPSKSIEWEITTLASGEEFVTKGSDIIEEGYLKILPERRDSAVAISDLATRSKVVASYEVYKIPDGPPLRYTEGTLAYDMEHRSGVANENDRTPLIKAGSIGKPAARYSAISELVKAGYLSKSGDAEHTLTITPEGVRVIEAVETDDLKLPALTAEWENDLDEIENLPPDSNPADIKKKVLVFQRKVEVKVTEWTKKKG